MLSSKLLLLNLPWLLPQLPLLPSFSMQLLPNQPWLWLPLQLLTSLTLPSSAFLKLQLLLESSSFPLMQPIQPSISKLFPLHPSFSKHSQQQLLARPLP